MGALPISDENDRLCGIVTDRDIVVKCIANGDDPATTTCADLCEGTPRWIDADSNVEEVLQELEGHQYIFLPCALVPDFQAGTEPACDVDIRPRIELRATQRLADHSVTQASASSPERCSRIRSGRRTPLHRCPHRGLPSTVNTSAATICRSATSANDRVTVGGPLAG
ncbi:CBS domain-containing protein [Nocardia wallacei]|uniref:CBS domain-containing protein n=1 Tax=Nocardia wallacei TaxID=480035 RepID=UPI00313C2C35